MCACTDLPTQCLAEWHHIGLQQKLNQVQMICWTTLRFSAGVVWELQNSSKNVWLNVNFIPLETHVGTAVNYIAGTTTF